MSEYVRERKNTFNLIKISQISSTPQGVENKSIMIECWKCECQHQMAFSPDVFIFIFFKCSLYQTKALIKQMQIVNRISNFFSFLSQ